MEPDKQAKQNDSEPVYVGRRMLSRLPWLSVHGTDEHFTPFGMGNRRCCLK